MLPRSIRWQLQLWWAFLLMCVVTTLGVTVDEHLWTKRLRQIDADLEVRVAALHKIARDYYRGRSRPRSGDKATLIAQPDGPYYFVVWYGDGTLLSSRNSPQHVMTPPRYERDTIIHFRTRRAYREALHCSELGGCVVIGRSVQADWEVMHRLGWALLGGGAVILALGLAVSWWLVTRAIRPIEQITAAATRFSEGNLAERIQFRNRGNELSRLAGVLNSTFARLESAFAQQQKFTAEAAHELRTPVAVIISETQTALARERTAAEYRQTVKAGLDTAQQMRRLTESLLELARCDTSDARIGQNDVDLAKEAQACIQRICPLAAERGIRLCQDFAPTRAACDSDDLERVISNLLSNAIYYNKQNGEVRLATLAEDDSAVLTVADTGIGIASSDLPRIFDRFYSVDKHRSRREGHTGLGLAICKAIVEAERGTIEVASTPNVGTIFTVRLPRAVETHAGRE